MMKHEIDINHDTVAFFKVHMNISGNCKVRMNISENCKVHVNNNISGNCKVHMNIYRNCKVHMKTYGNKANRRFGNTHSYITIWIPGSLRNCGRRN